MGIRVLEVSIFSSKDRLYGSVNLERLVVSSKVASSCERILRDVSAPPDFGVINGREVSGGERMDIFVNVRTSMLLKQLGELWKDVSVEAKACKENMRARSCCSVICMHLISKCNGQQSSRARGGTTACTSHVLHSIARQKYI